MRVLALALGIASLFAAPLGHSDVGTSVPAAEFSYVGPCWGTLTITGLPGSAVVVNAQRADGLYYSALSGVIPECGALNVAIAPIGPHNDGRPQFMVQVAGELQPPVFVMAGGPTDGEDWYWD